MYRNFHSDSPPDRKRLAAESRPAKPHGPMLRPRFAGDEAAVFCDEAKRLDRLTSDSGQVDLAGCPVCCGVSWRRPHARTHRPPWRTSSSRARPGIRTQFTSGPAPMSRAAFCARLQHTHTPSRSADSRGDADVLAWTADSVRTLGPGGVEALSNRNRVKMLARTDSVRLIEYPHRGLKNYGCRSQTGREKPARIRISASETQLRSFAGRLLRTTLESVSTFTADVGSVPLVESFWARWPGVGAYAQPK